VSILGGGNHPYFLEFPPIFSEAGGKFYIEREGKRSTNVINSHFSIKSPLFFESLINTALFDN
jgi:hypothetical protein